ncbi:hypothetical protein JTB14_019018 [Gonioctena quinquepunctata]|nr:hypothetical protein JTB14_019018 [Gonioctena quinquepunctata]
MDNATDFTNDSSIHGPNAMKIHLLDTLTKDFQIQIPWSSLNLIDITSNLNNSYIKIFILIEQPSCQNYLNTFAFECNNYLGRICYNKNGSINNKGKACLSRALCVCKDSVVKDHDNIVGGRESVIMESEENRDSSNPRQELQIAKKSTTTRDIDNFSEDNQEAISSDNHHFLYTRLSQLVLDT